MPSRSFCVAIVLLWAAVTGWYVHREVLPAGILSSPDYRSLVSRELTAEAVRWSVYQGDRLIGHAETHLVGQADGSHELRSTADFSELPAPLWLTKSLGSPSRLRAQAAFRINTQQNLEGFRLTLDAGRREEAIKVSGEVERQQLRVAFEFGSHRYELPPMYYAPHSVVGDVLSPTDHMGPLRPGQSWSVSMVNPLVNRVETLRAEVVRRETILWGGRRVETFVVQHQGDGVTGRAWVRGDGMVLKQDISLFWSTCTFVREPGPVAVRGEAADEPGPHR